MRSSFNPPRNKKFFHKRKKIDYRNLNNVKIKVCKYSNNNKSKDKKILKNYF